MAKKKLKTKRIAAKKFKVTKTGKVLFGHQFASHLKSGKSRRRKRRLKEPGQLKGKFAKKIKRMLSA